MGCISSSEPSAELAAGLDLGRKHSRSIQSDLRQDHEKQSQIFKLLLLGATKSGKTTVFQQVSYLHSDEGQKNDTTTTTNTRKNSNNLNKGATSTIDSDYIQTFTVSQMNQLVKSCMNEFKYNLKIESKQAFELITNYNNSSKKSNNRYKNETNKYNNVTMKDIGDNISLLWNDESIKKTFDNRDESQHSFNINDSCDYFFNDIKRISDEGYVPNEQDLLYTHKPTSGIESFQFVVKNHIFEVLDVGGLASERRKWIHFFDGVASVIYVTALSCYNQFIIDDENSDDSEDGISYNDEKQNAMMQSMNIFEEIANSRFLRLTPMILFLNKSDVFKKKIAKYPITVCFHDYNGDIKDFDACVEYIRCKFTRISENSSKRECYSHVTCATDRDNIKRVFNDVQHTVVMNSLRRNGLL